MLDSIMAEEGHDSSWTGEVASYADELFETERFDGSELLDADCRETICNVVVVHDGEGSFEEFKEHGTLLGPWSEGASFGDRELLEDGEIQTSLYFMRPGIPYPHDQVYERLDALLAESD